MNYKVYQGDELKQTVTSKTAVMNGLQPNKTYDFSVEPDDVQTVGGRTRYTHIAYANMKYIADENSSFTLSERATVRFGRDDKWVYKTFDAGTYPAENTTFGGDPYQGTHKVVELVSDFSVGQGSNKTYIGFYTDFIQTNSTNPLDYTWSTNAKTSVTTRGIRFNIPKTLTVGSTITLRYEEYPLGIVPIGNEPSGYFGGGNKQNLSAKVISTANGSSVVEVAGNVIDVGGRNLLVGSTAEFVTVTGTNWALRNLGDYSGLIVGNQYTASAYVGNADHVVNLEAYAINANGYRVGAAMGNVVINPNSRNSFTFKWIDLASSGVVGFRLRSVWTSAIDSGSYQVAQAKLEPGDTATPYASFVDGDTFTEQPDGTCALFSEHKALYY